MERNVTTVQEIYDAFGRGDVPGILAHLAPDVIWEQDGNSWGIPWYEPRRGHDGVVEFLVALGDGMVIHRMEPRNILVGGDQVAVVMDLEAEVKAGGRRLQELEIHLWTFDGSGMVTRFAHVLDRHPQLAAFRGEEP